ncbi:FGGY-family carbohydrate kinase [Anaerocolumna jejuensis]|uniref:FGGY-family carbohydrate kinase n=1 Tax=Anaerocolumna jejuensis TaxID=259063 RepID=UPI003F7C4E99
MEVENGEEICCCTVEYKHGIMDKYLPDLIETTAFGTRIIIEAFEGGGVPINELYAAGGIAQKNEMMMQIYADVTNKEIHISSSKQAPALGAALFGAVAAGATRGGYDTIESASEHMSRL